MRPSRSDHQLGSRRWPRRCSRASTVAEVPDAATLNSRRGDGGDVEERVPDLSFQLVNASLGGADGGTSGTSGTSAALGAGLALLAESGCTLATPWGALWGRFVVRLELAQGADGGKGAGCGRGRHCATTPRPYLCSPGDSRHRGELRTLLRPPAAGEGSELIEARSVRSAV